MGFQQGLSGLNISAKALDAIGNNIANSNTVGFKNATAIFADVYASALTGSSASGQVGQGGSVATIAQAFTQGNVSSSANPLDIAINGNGFLLFQPTLDDASAEYSRNGQLFLNSDGYIVNAQGKYLSAYTSPDGLQIDSTTAKPIQISSAPLSPRVTGYVNKLTPGAGGVQVGINLDVRDKRLSASSTSTTAAAAAAAVDIGTGTGADIVAAEALATSARTNSLNAGIAALADPENILAYADVSPADLASPTLSSSVLDSLNATANSFSVVIAGADATNHQDYNDLFINGDGVNTRSLQEIIRSALSDGYTDPVSGNTISGAYPGQNGDPALDSAEVATAVKSAINANLKAALENATLTAPATAVSLQSQIQASPSFQSALNAAGELGRNWYLAYYASQGGADATLDATDALSFQSTLIKVSDAAETAFTAAEVSAKQDNPATGWTSLQAWDLSNLNPGMYNYSTSVSVFDQRGESHILTSYYVRQSADDGTGKLIGTGKYEMHVVLDDKYEIPVTNVLSGAKSNDAIPATIDFTAAGQLDPASENGPLWNLDLSNAKDKAGATVQLDKFPTDFFETPVAGGYQLSLDFSSATNFGSPYDVNKLTQDGFGPGRITGLAIDKDGFISARYSNGQTQLQGRVTLTNFTNPNGLISLGNNMWGETSASGPALIGVPNSGSRGSIQSGAVEDSNVDLTGELVDLIVMQRAYQANAQTIKTQDSVLQTLVNLR